MSDRQTVGRLRILLFHAGLYARTPQPVGKRIERPTVPTPNDEPLSARTVYAVDLHLDGVPTKARTDARVLARRWAITKVGPWPEDQPSQGCRFTVGGSTVATRSASSQIGDRLLHFWEMTVVEPHVDSGLQVESAVIVGGDDMGAFAQIRTGLASSGGHSKLTGWVPFDPTPPTLTFDLVREIGATDARAPLTSTPVKVISGDQTRAVATLIADPSRRLPVVLTTRTAGAPISADAVEVAELCAGIAHVYDIESDDEARHLQRLLGGRFMQSRGDWRIFFAGWTPGDRVSSHPEWRADRQRGSNHRTFGTSVSRKLIAMAAFRVVPPPWVTAVAVAANHERIRRLRADVEGRPPMTEETLNEWERDLVRLDKAEADLAALRDEVARIAGENRELRQIVSDPGFVATRQAMTEGRDGVADPAPGPGDSASDLVEHHHWSSVAEAVEAAALDCTSLVFLPQAHETAAACKYRWPERIYEDLVLLNEVVEEWQATGRLAGGWKRATTDAGLGWASDVSATAKDRFADDYTVTTGDGTKILLGPHLRRGAATGPVGHYRCYLHIDETERKVYIGYIGKHLRDASNR